MIQFNYRLTQKIGVIKVQYTSYVNVFCGSSDFNYNNAKNLSALWEPIKPETGNTHPGAQLPFGKLSVLAYSGAYPTGYGYNLHSSEKNRNKKPSDYMYDRKKIIGLSHIHQSGVGAIGYYYNYAIATCFYGDMTKPEPHNIVEEKAVPGYYSALDEKTDIKYEATTDEKCAVHRYTFKKNNGRCMIDFSNDGLLIDRTKDLFHKKCSNAIIKICDNNTVTAEVTLHGMTLFFCVKCKNKSVKLWKDYKEINETTLVTNGDESEAFGCVFDMEENTAELKLSVSLKSTEKAIQYIDECTKSFDEISLDASHKWEDALSAIKIEASDKEKRVFYSNLYHSLTKPSDWAGENIYSDDEDFVVDFATLWDVYKTQFPLIFTLYPQMSKKILNTYLTLKKKVGVMPNTFALNSEMKVEANQARLLSAYMFCDGFYRNISGVDFDKAVKCLYDELMGDDYKEFFENGELERTTYTLDISQSCHNISLMARNMGNEEVFNKLNTYADNAFNAFDEKTGLLKENSRYYEGNHWSYSFRPLHDNKKRMDISGGEEKYVELLDTFFGFKNPDERCNRFQGFNNETDMESPYAYSYTSKHSRICEIIDAMNDLFTDGDDGIPGNADSGGLTSCYIWNNMGIFPVSGKDIMLIGTPRYRQTEISLNNGNKFVIKKTGEGIYVKNAYLSGRKLDDFSFSVTEMMQGGELHLEMTDECK